MIRHSLIVLALATLSHAQSPGLDSAAGSSADAIRGKAIFASRCASCHDENGGKKLADGTTLIARLAQSKGPEARLGTRLKDPKERREVWSYLQSALERSGRKPGPSQR